MIKFLNTGIVFREIPEMVSLAINISNCQNNCHGCHSSYLKQDIGEELTDEKLKDLIGTNKGIDCVIFMGEGNDTDRLIELAHIVKQNNVLAAIYSGRNNVEDFYYNVFDYIKIGSYKERFGSLDKKTTNQKLFEKTNNGIFQDITFKFWE